MSLVKLSTDPIVKRLRWVMLAAMLFSLVVTLLGQADSFWHHAQTAIRADGLSIDNKTNHTFEFFIGRGWQAYLIANVIYFLGAFLLVSALPRVMALTVIFSFIFGHFFGASNWLAIRWHLGVQGPLAYSLVLGPTIVFLAFAETNSNTDKIIKRLRWVMVGALLLDMIITLIGQPASYWSQPETVHEANQLSRFFLMRGWYAYLLEQLVYCCGVFWLVTKLPQMWGIICIFCFILGGFTGSSCWFFFQWRLGMEAPVIYGIILSLLIVLEAFPEVKLKKGKLKTALGSTT